MVVPGSWRANAPADRGYNARWRKLRAAHLAKHPFCVRCLIAAGVDHTLSTDQVVIAYPMAANGLPYGTVVDHIKSHRGNASLMYDADNLQTLCKRHHDSDKQKEEIAEMYHR